MFIDHLIIQSKSSSSRCNHLILIGTSTAVDIILLLYWVLFLTICSIIACIFVNKKYVEHHFKCVIPKKTNTNVWLVNDPNIRKSIIILTDFMKFSNTILNTFINTQSVLNCTDQLSSRTFNNHVFSFRERYVCPIVSIHFNDSSVRRIEINQNAYP